MAATDLSAERLRELLDYDPETGVFTQKTQTSNRVKVGDTVGSPEGSGYLAVRISGHRHKCHRLAWLYVYGRFPINCIDHINGLRTDNRITNLREATHSENAQNRAIRKDSPTGLVGVEPPNGSLRSWRAHIRANGKQIQLGSFKSEGLAYAAYLAAKAQLHTFNPLPRV